MDSNSMSARSESTRSYDADSIFTHDTINTTTDTINTVPRAHPDNLDKHVPAWNHSHMSYHLPAHMQSRAVPRGAAGIERRPLSRFLAPGYPTGASTREQAIYGFTWQMDWARPTRLRRHGKMPAVSMALRGWRHASACRNHRAPPRTASRSRLCAGRWSSSPWLCNFKVDSAISSVEPPPPTRPLPPWPEHDGRATPSLFSGTTSSSSSRYYRPTPHPDGYYDPSNAMAPRMDHPYGLPSPVSSASRTLSEPADETDLTDLARKVDALHHIVSSLTLAPVASADSAFRYNINSSHIQPGSKRYTNQNYLEACSCPKIQVVQLDARSSLAG
ncbi:hypothetical protein L1887_50878 [Cichorium endivia]|nr:hypothetical protein L1887_50878 [Cichorium endivia]